MYIHVASSCLTPGYALLVSFEMRAMSSLVYSPEDRNIQELRPFSQEADRRDESSPPGAFLNYI